MIYHLADRGHVVKTSRVSDEQLAFARKQADLGFEVMGSVARSASAMPRSTSSARSTTAEGLSV